MKFGRVLELSEQQVSQVEKATSDVSAIKTKTSELPSRSCQQNENSSQPRDRRSQSRNRQHFNKRNKKSGKCENCGGYALHRNPCPARGKSCNACGKIGHFAHVCRSKPRTKPRTVAHVESSHSSGEEYEYVYTVNYIDNKKPPMCEGKAVEMKIDTGASVNLLNEETFRRINSGNTTLKPAHTKVYSHGSKAPLPLLGTLSATVSSSSISTNTQLHVVKGNTGNLLSYNNAKKLNVVTISVNTATVTAKNKNSPEVLQEEFKCLFGGIEKIQNKVVKLHVDPDVTPRKQPHRRIPFHVRRDVEKELERLERLDIIEKVKSPKP